MSLSIARGKSIYAYQIKVEDPCTVWVRKNKHNVRWKVWGSFDTAEQATDALLSLKERATDAHRGAGETP